MSSAENKLSGIVPPMITPLTGRDTLDIAGLERLIEHILSGGVSGLFILGTTGEAPNLSYRLRRELIERVCKQVSKRVPVLVGITDTSYIESINIANHASDCGADAVVAAPPYYFQSGQPELIDYYKHLDADAPLPIYLYNMPSMTKTVIELETVRILLDLEKIKGVKDSSGNSEYYEFLLSMVREKRPDCSVLVGPEALLAETVVRGGDGGVNGGANLLPELFVKLYVAAKEGNNANISQLQKIVLTLDKIYRIGHHSSSIIKGLKCSLSLISICDDFMAEPFVRFNPDDRAKVKVILEDMERNNPSILCSLRQLHK